MENKININKEQLEKIQSDIYYIKTYSEALNIEFNKEEQYVRYVNEKVNLIEKHLNNIKKICKL